MKVMVIQVVRDLGVPEIRTLHHPDNGAPIALKRRLGYVDPKLLRCRSKAARTMGGGV